MHVLRAASSRRGTISARENVSAAILPRGGERGEARKRRLCRSVSNYWYFVLVQLKRKYNDHLYHTPIHAAVLYTLQATPRKRNARTY